MHLKLSQLPNYFAGQSLLDFLEEEAAEEEEEEDLPEGIGKFGNYRGQHIPPPPLPPLEEGNSISQSSSSTSMQAGGLN